MVTLTDQALIKEDDLLELTGDLLSLVEAGHRRIVLDFAAVERLSSWAASMLSDAVRRCGQAEGGAVKFSGLGRDVVAIFARLDGPRPEGLALSRYRLGDRRHLAPTCPNSVPCPSPSWPP